MKARFTHTLIVLLIGQFIIGPAGAAISGAGACGQSPCCCISSHTMPKGEVRITSLKENCCCRPMAINACRIQSTALPVHPAFIGNASQHSHIPFSTDLQHLSIATAEVSKCFNHRRNQNADPVPAAAPLYIAFRTMLN